MRVYQTNPNGVLLFSFEAEKNKRDGEWIIPGGCYTDPPPSFDKETQFVRWDDGQQGWVIEQIPSPPEPELEIKAPEPPALPPPIADLTENRVLEALEAAGVINASARQKAVEHLKGKKNAKA